MRFARVVCLIVALQCAARAHAAGTRPNIIIILADDLGYSDIGCMGGEIRTPNIDALAKDGLRFTQFYNCGRCCPTRASLLTGLYPHQAGVGRMTNDARLPGYRGHLTENAVTIAEVLRAAGYRTAMAGKWHLSNTREGPDHLKYLNNQAILSRFADPQTYPVARGFEEHYGVIWGVVNYFDPFSLVHNADPVREVPRDYYITDAIHDHAIEYLEKYGRGPEPFFLYVAETAPHWPLHAREEDIRRYENTYRAGWDAIREARFSHMRELGVLPPGADKLGPRDHANEKWEDNPTREFDSRAMAVHAAMVDRMDQGIGRIIARLRDMKQLDNTLILFLSDNGASPEIMSEPGFDRPSQTRDGRAIHYTNDKKVLPGSQVTYGAIGPIWASVANTPLRYWKAEMYEGGTLTPLIVHWPAGLKTKAGSITNQVGHVMDIMSTCVELAGTTYPREFRRQTITPTAGQSLLPILQGQTPAQRAMLAWEHYGAKAIRMGDWKLVSRRTGPWSLFDLSVDRAEQNDLAGEYPDRVREMEQRWKDWARNTRVFPAPGK